jgi:hypothetical protein
MNLTLDRHRTAGTGRPGRRHHQVFVPKEKLSEHNGGEWTANAGVGVVKTLGVLELPAVVGLILPAVLDIAPRAIRRTGAGR